ncbi:MAG: heme-copper oxidase subunit III [Spirochaetaceae bacterium]|nr:heme-copper oxidase subunit III [Myxococcales bacterium]MCB9725904.1 heme-copper oxidase subunit III [Spirochaetaceae bacterium]HPG26164.1 heme-copper oxidase subunit III [Myxococcota bacterium]
MSVGSYQSSRMRLVAEERGEPRVVSNGVLGMVLFVMTEIMLFAGMISAFSIVRASSAIWPPPNQPRLPFEETAINTLALFVSGALLILAQRRFAESRRAARAPLVGSIVLGAFFVLFQGWEWASMLAQGLTLTSSTLGSFFYLIVGTHALHAIAAIWLLFRTWRRLERGWLHASQLATAAVLWYFVVGAWPLIYWRVYL